MAARTARTVVAMRRVLVPLEVEEEDEEEDIFWGR